MLAPKLPTGLSVLVESQLGGTQQNTMLSSPTTYTLDTPSSSSSSYQASVWDVIDLTSDDEDHSSPSSVFSPSATKTTELTTIIPATLTEDIASCHIQSLPDVILMIIGEYAYAGIIVHHYKGRAGKVKKNQLSQINSALSATCKKFNEFFTRIMTSSISFRFDSIESMIDCIASMTRNAVKNIKKVHVVERPFSLTFEDQVIKKVGKKEVMKLEHTTCLYTLPDIFTLFPHLQCDILVYEGYLPGLEEPSLYHTNSSISALIASGGWKRLYCIQTTFDRESNYLPFSSWLMQLYDACSSKPRMAEIANILPPESRPAAINYTPFWTSFKSSVRKATPDTGPTDEKIMHGALSVALKRKSNDLSSGEKGWAPERIVRFEKAMDEAGDDWFRIKNKGRFHSLK